MELIEKNMSSLFKQLGELHDEVGIANFIALHGCLSGDTHLHEAGVWSPSQASFLREALLQDAAWAQALNALPGYQSDHSGEVQSLSGLLPWWTFKRAKKTG
mgnify:CR=1 FL=1